MIFSYYREDWNKLREYLSNGSIPDWNKGDNRSERETVDNPKAVSFSEIDGREKSQRLNSKIYDENLLKSNEVESNPKIIAKTESIQKEDMQWQWIRNIQEKYPDKLSNQTLERFNKVYPSINELAEELGCPVYNTEKELGRLMAYLKCVEIHDLYEPLNLKQRYIGWKNENLGQNLMEIEFVKLLDGKKIEFQRVKIANDINSLVINKNFLIYLVFEEADFQKFLQFIEPENLLNKYIKIALVIHTIELRYYIENKLKDTPLIQKIEVYSYDWSDLGPMVRNLASTRSRI